MPNLEKMKICEAPAAERRQTRSATQKNALEMVLGFGLQMTPALIGTWRQWRAYPVGRR